MTGGGAGGIVFMSIVVLVGCGGGTDTSSGPASGGGGGESGIDAGPTSDAGDAGPSAVICTSGMTWTRGDHGSSQMNPGRACIACHTTMNGPPLTIAGTVYPTAHEPDLCDGASGSNGVRIEITGSDGQTLTLEPNGAGNFDTGAPVKFPFAAKVTYMGRERAMSALQTTGDCNGCHTEAGASGAPGRIQLP